MTRATFLSQTTAILLAATSPALAQQSPQPDCENAARTVGKGRVAAADYPAFRAARRCGALGANAIATALANSGSESDIRALTTFMAQVDAWRDGSVLEAALRLAMDNSATPEARVFAVRHLIQLVQPNYFYSFEGLTKKADTTKAGDFTVYTAACSAQISPPRERPTTATPLPGGYEAQIRATLSSLASSPATPEAVRSAARCLRTWP